MTDNKILEDLLKKGTVTQVLQRSNTPKQEVQSFKELLYQLGFAAVKEEATQEIDEIYGDSTVSSVKDFCQRNEIDSDGERVSVAIARMMQKRYELLQPMLELHQHLHNDKLGAVYYKGSPHTEAVKGLQKLLKEALGHPMDISGNSGDFDEATMDAINALVVPTEEKQAAPESAAENPEQPTEVNTAPPSEQIPSSTPPPAGDTDQSTDSISGDKTENSSSPDAASTENPKQPAEVAAMNLPVNMVEPVPTTEGTTSEDQESDLDHFCRNILAHFDSHKEIGQILQAGKEAHPYVGELQHVLHKLGFGDELGQEINKLDGVFGSGVVNAVKSFSQKNGIPSDGKQITSLIAQTMNKRLDSLPFMHQLQRDLREGKVEQKYFKGTTAKTAVSALQYVLKDLGLGQHLKWGQKANDGVFDDNVVKALKSHFKKGYFDVLTNATPHMVFTLIKDIGVKYGSNWKDHTKSLDGDTNALLTRFTASNFIGKPIIANITFVPSLQKINLYAKKNNVKIYINESFRPANAHLSGTIVKPASHSNHKVGHAIDMNIQYDGGKLANHTYMYKTNRANWQADVRGFLDDITADLYLRWGGNFHTSPDPVHIDDNFNHNHTVEEFNKEYQLANQAFTNNKIRPA